MEELKFGTHKFKKNAKNVLASKYTLAILLRILHGYRPSQIAKQLRVSPQLIHYHLHNLIHLKLICKGGNRDGLTWNVTALGLFILKQMHRQSVKNSNNSRFGLVPMRIHNYTIEFRVESIPERLNHLNWKPMKNGVSKLVIRYHDHTEELIRSSKDDWASALLIHIPEQYFLDPINGIIKLYGDACDYANKTAQRLGIEISSRGKVVGKPHFAFERDIIAMYLATFQASETNTCNSKGDVWIDASQGTGELETNDIDYAYKYLSMPDNILEIHQIVKRKSSRYLTCYDPYSTDNN